MIGDGVVAEVIRNTWLGCLTIEQDSKPILGGSGILIVKYYSRSKRNARRIVCVLSTSGDLGWLYEDQIVLLSSAVP